MYVVSLVGKDVFQNRVIVCTMTQMDNLDRVCVYIKQKYGVEFEKLANRFSSCFWGFDNITDNRDITLVVEKVDTEDDIEGFIY